MIFNINIDMRRDTTMTAISLKLSDKLAQESKAIAETIGISRTELIRQALRHEVNKIKAQLERTEMAEALRTMSTDMHYIQESESVYKGLEEKMPEEHENWWQG